MEILDGRSLSLQIKEEVKEKIKKEFLDKKPSLACIIVEGNKASEIYVSSKIKACDYCNINSRVVKLPQMISQQDLENEIEKLNCDDDINAILLQLPLPEHLNSAEAINKIIPQKDVDCLSDFNLGRLFSGNSSFAPCTATGIIKLLDKYKISLQGKNVVVIGRSLLVGKSVACLFEQRDCTVTICHSKTKNLKDYTLNADIVVVAIGKARFITQDYLKKDTILIDVGINRIDGKIYGDVDFENVKDICSYITPVPGGVGPLTVACLMENTLTLSLQQMM